MLATRTKQYNHLDIGHPDNPKPWAICGAKRRRRDEVCTQRAGWRTDHVGVGRCTYHGGSSVTGVNHPGYKHGRYLSGLPGALGAIYNQVSAARSDNPLDLYEELNTQRTLLMVQLYKLEGVDLRKLSPADVDRLGAAMNGGEDVIDLDAEKAGVGGVVVVDGSMVSSLSAPVRGKTKNSKGKGVVGGGVETTGKDTLGVGGGGLKKLGGGVVAVEEGQIQIIRDLINDIVSTSQKISGMINQDRLTSAEILFVMGALKEVVNEFLPDVEKQRQFINRLRERIPSLIQQGGGQSDK